MGRGCNDEMGAPYAVAAPARVPGGRHWTE